VTAAAVDEARLEGLHAPLEVVAVLGAAVGAQASSRHAAAATTAAAEAAAEERAADAVAAAGRVRRRRRGDRRPGVARARLAALLARLARRSWTALALAADLPAGREKRREGQRCDLG